CSPARARATRVTGERRPSQVRTSWTATIKITDAANVRELALAACPGTDQDRLPIAAPRHVCRPRLPGRAGPGTAADRDRWRVPAVPSATSPTVFRHAVAAYCTS